MEIEIGEYVRTKNGYIRKIVTKRLNGYLVDLSYYNEIIQEYTVGIIELEDIKKHSKNIIDLLEVGDIIDYYSNYLGTYIKAEVVNVINEKEDYEWGKGYCSTCIDEHIRISEIKTILTKEKYEANCYVVKE